MSVPSSEHHATSPFPGSTRAPACSSTRPRVEHPATTALPRITTEIKDRLLDNSNPQIVPKNTNILPIIRAIVLAALAILSFHLAYTFSALSSLILIYLICLFQLSRLPSAHTAFYFGFAAGVGCALQTSFFWNIFGPAAFALWAILGFWTGLFVALVRATRARLGELPALLLTPLLWTGLEYFRSELYYLRFSWLNVSYVFSAHLAWMPIKYLGMYGVGFCLMALVCCLDLLRFKPRLIASALAFATLAALSGLTSPKAPPSTAQSGGNLRIAGLQLEFPSEPQVLNGLNTLIKQHPDCPLLILSEYTFTGPVPDSLKNWCRRNHRYVIVGAEDPVSEIQYRDTAFIIGPDGNIVFQQAKCVPIQMFKDGLPAESQKLWASPWGKIGICICYDLSYTRVTDQLIRLGAQAIIVPSMDVAYWGQHQHELHYRVAPIRAAEYGVPVFRLASSGISQSVNSSGIVLATAPFPGDGAIISSTLNLNKPGTLLLDRFLTPLAVAADALLITWLAILSLRKCDSAQQNAKYTR